MNPEQYAGAGTAVSTQSGESLYGATIMRLAPARAEPGLPYGVDIVERLRLDGLLGHVLWTTECLPTDVDALTFRRLRDDGLLRVRLHLTGADPRELLVAVQTLRRLDVLIEYDLDLFGHAPRFASVRDAVAVLSTITADGTTPALFRVGPVWNCSPWVASFHQQLDAAAAPWIGENGLSARLALAWAEVVVADRLLLGVASAAAQRIALQRLTMRSNTALLALVSQAAADFELAGESKRLDPAAIAIHVADLSQALTDLHTRFLSPQLAS
ncbi:hypothetical protein OG394_28900 [Kribbella sp. NBC_01245]|uniref:hypothetical protein n=1 Tax=Kribbella sp. NBC_01245 TaxID=2903578 RepID=UPI002E2D2F9C|nr:hypothetical protein [Kribbella sp. NBC_01245]